MNISKSNIKAIITLCLKELKIPFVDPCDPSYEGDCICDTGTGVSGSFSINSIEFTSTDNPDTLGMQLTYTDDNGTSTVNSTIPVTTLDNQDLVETNGVLTIEGGTNSVDLCQVLNANCPVTLTYDETKNELTFTGLNGVPVSFELAKSQNFTQSNLGNNIPATLVDPTIPVTPVAGDSTVQQYDNGAVVSTFDGTTWTNTALVNSPNTFIDLTNTITDPFDTNDAVLDCNLYTLGQKLVVGTNQLCPDFIYEVVSDGTGGCRTIMVQKPDNAGSNFGG